MPLARLDIPHSLLDVVIKYAQNELPNECCGLLAGVVENGIGRVTAVQPLVNELNSPNAFRTEAGSLFQAYREMRQSGTDVLAVYHSHPTTPPIPSRRDVAENTYGPHVAWVIISLAMKEPDVAVWWLSERGYTTATWRIT